MNRLSIGTWLAGLDRNTIIGWLVFAHLIAFSLAIRWGHPEQELVQVQSFLEVSLAASQPTMLIAWLIWGRRWFTVRFLVAVFYPWAYWLIVTSDARVFTLVVHTALVAIISFGTCRLLGWRLHDQHKEGSSSLDARYGIKDILLLTTLVSIALAVLRHKITGSTLTVDDVVMHLKLTPEFTPPSVSAVCMFMSALSTRRWAWGTAALFAGMATPILILNTPGYPYPDAFAFGFAIATLLNDALVFSTAIGIRIAGFTIR